MRKDIRDIDDFHAIKTANYVAGLLVDPKYQANTFRIELLIHYIIANCNGVQKPSSKKIQEWLNEFQPISSLSYMEDPTEDVFVTKVLTKWGDFRLYDGIWEANDFHLQKVIDTIKTIPADFNIESLFNPIRSLLVLSEEVAKRNKANLYEIADSNAKGFIDVPSNETLKKLAKTLIFTTASIEKLRLSLDDLVPFIFDFNKKIQLNEQRLGNTELEHSPLIYDGNKLFLILPTAVSVAIRRFIFEWLYERNLVENFEKVFVGEYVKFLHETSILGEELPPNLPIKPQKISKSYFLEFNTEIEKGRFLQIIVRIDTLHGFFEDGMDEPAPYSHEQSEEIEKRIKSAKKIFMSKEHYRGGLSLIISAGYGRPFMGEFTKEASDWFIQFISSNDLETISWIPDAPKKSIWILLDKIRELEEKKINFINVNGLLNMYGWWEDTEYILIPDEVDVDQKKCVIYLPTDSLTKIRQKTRLASDLHTEMYIDGNFKRVRRIHLSSLFKDKKRQPLYACYEDRHERNMLGCVTTKTRPWWVSLDLNNTEIKFNTSFQIWDALLQWMERISEVIENKFSNITIGPVLFLLDLSILKDYEYLPEKQPNSLSNYIDIKVDKNKNTIIIKLQDSFLFNMNNPTNISERELVRSCIEGFVGLVNLNVDSNEIKIICDHVVPNQDARFMHSFKAYEFRDHMRAFDKCEHQVIEECDANYLKISLGHIEGDIGYKEIIGKEDCTSFLNKVVTKSWLILKGELKKYNRESLIIKMLRNIEGIAGEKTQWNRTARALFSLHKDKDDVHVAKIKYFTSLYGADLACRVIVEIAVCESPLEGGYEVGNLDMSPLMAMASMLFHMGNTSDAIDKGVTEPRIVVANNGDVKSNHSFHDEIISPFFEQYEKKNFTSSSDKYEEHFEEASPPKSPSEYLHEDFLIAFEKEFGISVKVLRDFRDEMEKMAEEKKRYVFSAAQSEIISYCEKSNVCNKKDVLKILNSFSLKSRKHWEKPCAPYKTRDINPWLFRRRLSLLLKMYVKINNDEDPIYIISPGISSLALAYTLDTYWSCNMDEDRCESKEMKMWIGRESARRGHEFNKTVSSKLSSIGYNARSDVKVSSIFSNKTLERDYGDIDVLAWKEGEKFIFLIECKDLQFAKTTKEIAEQLMEFRGDIRNGKPDRLKKHIDRVEIISNYKSELLKYCDLKTNSIVIVPYVIFSNPVPMLYDSSIPNNIKFSFLEEVENMGLSN